MLFVHRAGGWHWACDNCQHVLAPTSGNVHGTTTGTNAIVTRTGARVGLLTSAGHGDVMYIMKGTGRTAGVPADELMDLVASRSEPSPIVPKNLIVEATFARISLAATKTLQEQGFAEDDIVLARSVRMKYAVQVYDIDVPVAGPVSGAEDIQSMLDSFEEAYAQRFGRNAGFREGGVHVTGFQVRAVGVTRKLPLVATAHEPGAAFEESSRRVYWPELGDWVEAAVLRTAGRWSSL